MSFRRLNREFRTGPRYVDVCIMHIDADDNEIGEVTYRVGLHWYAGYWEIDSIAPEVTGLIEEQVCAAAVQKAEEAVIAALDEAEGTY